MSLLLRKNRFLRSCGCMFLLDWIGSHALSLLLRLPPGKLKPLTCSMKFLSLEVTLYLHKSTMQPYMEYCCYVWAGALSCYLEILDKLQKWVCRTVSPSLADFLEFLDNL